MLAIDCRGVAASECEFYLDFRARRHLLESFAAMAHAPVHGMPLGDGIVDRPEGATAAAGAACTLQALARPVTQKAWRLSRQNVSTECAAASGAGAASGFADIYAVFTCVSTYLS